MVYRKKQDKPLKKTGCCYPFGLEHQKADNTASSSNLGQNWKYQNQERSEDLGLIIDEWKYRISDSSIGRFWQVDPLTEDYMDWGPYVFSGNRVTDARELEGLEPISIHTRSFAPFDYFGFVPPFGPFIGDGANRSFQTAPNASSRISGRVDLNLSGDGITQTNSDADGSRSINLLSGRSKESKGYFNASLSNTSSNGTKASGLLNFHIFGNNSLVPFSPDIDAKGNLTINLTQNDDGTSSAAITGQIYGDNFPANETFVTDQNGTAVFLGTSNAIMGPNSGPAFALPGDNNRPMSTVNATLNFDKSGGVYSVQQGDQTYTVEEWNKRFQ